MAKVEKSRPPMTARPSGADWAPPSPMPMAIGTMPQIIGGGGHEDGAEAAERRPRGRRRGPAGPRGASRSAKVTSRIEFATAIPIAMIAPMNDWTFRVVPVRRSMRRTPHRTAGIVSRMASARRTDWKLAASSRKIASDGEEQADAEAVEGLLERRDLAAHADAEAAGRSAGGGDRPLQQWAPPRPSVTPWMLAVRLTMCWPL